MIDYEDIGRRIREVRLSRNMTQEQLAELTGVGTTHISHLETGNSTPSLKTFIHIVNALHCSCDQLLCNEVETAQPIFHSWLAEQLDSCSKEEKQIITDIILALKKSLDKNLGEEESS